MKEYANLRAGGPLLPRCQPGDKEGCHGVPAGFPAAAGRTARLLPVPAGEAERQIRQAAWVARCVGRGRAAPLRPANVAALASTLAVRIFAPGSVLFASGDQTPGVWIVRGGRIELLAVRGAAAPWSSCCAPVMWTATSTCYWRCPCPTPAAPCPASRACFLPATISSGCSALTRRSPGGGCPAWPAAGGKPGPCLRAARRIADRSGLQTTRRRGCERAGRAAAADPGGDARRAAAVLEVGAQGPGTRRLDHDQLSHHRDPRCHQARLPGLTRRPVHAGAWAAGSHTSSARCVRLLTLSAAGGAPARKSMAEGSVIKRPLPPSGRAGWPGWKAIGLSG